MSTVDKILHTVGLAAAGVLITAMSGGLALPLAVKIACVAVAFGTGTISNPVKDLFGKATEPPK